MYGKVVGCARSFFLSQINICFATYIVTSLDQISADFIFKMLLKSCGDNIVLKLILHISLLDGTPSKIVI